MEIIIARRFSAIFDSSEDECDQFWKEIQIMITRMARKAKIGPLDSLVFLASI